MNQLQSNKIIALLQKEAFGLLGTPPTPTIPKPTVPPQTGQQPARNYYDRVSNTWKPWVGSQYDSTATKAKQAPVFSSNGRHMWADGMEWYKTKDENGNDVFQGNLFHQNKPPAWVQNPTNKADGFAPWGERLLAKYRNRK